VWIKSTTRPGLTTNPTSVRIKSDRPRLTTNLTSVRIKSDHPPKIDHLKPMTAELFPSAATTDLSHLFNLTHPEWTTYDQWVVSFGVSFAICGGLGNLLQIPLFARDGGLLSYSKFAQNVKAGPNVSSRLGMFLIYFPAFLLSLLLVTDEHIIPMPRVWITAMLLTVHFGKRSSEVLFLHRFSGTMPLLSSITISTFYCALTSITIHYAAHSARVHDQATEPTTNMDVHVENIIDTLFVGISLFAVGQLGNLYHHWLLSTLRKPGDTSYKVPMGGLFSNFGGAAAPHYLFELVAWSGVSLVTKHTVSCLFTIGMACYLFERSVAQNHWNKTQLKDKYPETRKNMIPFVW
jgi:very-long-chain enoyl-CoA reductase